MRFAVVLLWITCVLFVGFGLGFAFAPRELAELVTGAAPRTASGSIDMRATYGGVAFGLGVFVGITARRRETVRLGLVASLLTVASIGAARLVGIVVDGSPNAFMLLFFSLEVLTVVLMAIALRAVRPGVV